MLQPPVSILSEMSNALDVRVPSHVFIQLLHENPDAAKWRIGSDKTYLMVAAGLDRLDIVEKLIEYKADINAVSASGQTVLMHAQSQSMARFLVNHGADIDAIDHSHNKYTALHSLLTRKLDSAAAELIVAGANCDITTAQGDSALDIAVRNGCYHSCTLLAEKAPEESLKRARDKAREIHHLQDNYESMVIAGVIDNALKSYAERMKARKMQKADHMAHHGVPRRIRAIRRIKTP